MKGVSDSTLALRRAGRKADRNATSNASNTLPFKAFQTRPPFRSQGPRIRLSR
jgi:hypothetical protein